VEKPIFQTLDEAEQIRTIAAQKGCKFSAVHNQKYLYGIQHALKLVKDRYIGDVNHIHVARMINGNHDRFVADDNSWCHKLPGGRWEELIAHPLYKAYQFMGPMRFVHLEMKQVYNRWPWLPADELDIVLEGATGYVSIKLSANAGDYNHMLVYGSKRILFIDSNIATDLLSINQSRDSKASLRKWLSKRLIKKQSTIPNSLRQNPFATLIKDFVTYVSGESAEAPVDWQEAVNTLELGLQIGKAIESRKSTIHLK
jgi:predicted dehydrogenase